MFEFKERRRNIPDEELLEDVKRVAEKLNSQTLTRGEYEEHGKYGFTTVLRRLGKWSEVLEKLGLGVKVPIYNTNEELFSNLAEVWTKLGEQPSYKALSKDISRFSVGTYENRFGSWNDALRAFVDYINGEEIDLPIISSQDKSKQKQRTPRNINWRLRAKVLIRDNCICQMCGTSPAKDSEVVLHVDHIHPWSKGGETVEENLRTLCSRCNIGKSDMVIEE
ncbi:MAG: HNH endonuclease [Rhizobiales bacterium]|nr:HNH endonuclease [Hyphomicrobiales bacterium]